MKIWMLNGTTAFTTIMHINIYKVGMYQYVYVCYTWKYVNKYICI